MDSLMSFFGLVMAFGWCIIRTDLCDSAASLWPLKELVSADGTRSLKGKGTEFVHDNTFS